MNRALLSSALLTLALAGCQDATTTGRTLTVQLGEGGQWDDPDAVPASLSFSIQSAIDAASSGDTVSVPSGNYYEDLTMKDGVAVVGAGSDETYLYGSVSFSSNTGASLSDMTLFDYTYASTGTAYTETGILVSGGDAEITDVGAYYFNAAIEVDSADTVTIDNARLGGNWYGISADASTTVDISNSFIYSNAAGGIATNNGTGGQIVHNTLIANGFGGSTAYLTGAISMGVSGSEDVYNNILTSNYYGLNCYSCSSAWGYNLVWGNSTDYVNDAASASSDLSEDPQFNNPSEGDYSLSSTSACIDAGTSAYTVSTDYSGEARPQGSAVDIGMDEYATTSYDLLITEVLANARVESKEEFVEIYNAGSTSVDLDGLILTDGDDTDTLQAYGSSATTLAAGEYAVVLDSEYDGEYTIDSAVTLLTTGDTNLGNGLTTSDSLTLYESDGSTIIATFSHPSDPGESTSMEMYNLDNGDAAGNWRASQCEDGYSPGAEHCFPESGDPAELIITEVMANAKVEQTGEYIEIYNPTSTEIDLAGLVISDGSSTDTLEAFNAGSTLLGPSEHGLIIDPNYAYDYYLPTDILLVTTGDSTLGNGLSTSDSVYLYDTDGSTMIDSFGYPSNPGDGYSMEKIDYTAGDTSTNWQAATAYCTRGASPGRLNGAAGGICDPLVITEVMANADDEDTGEFIELYNAGWDTIDLAGLIFTDGDEVDTLTSFDGGSTELDPGAYAVIVDSEYDSDYSIDSAAIVVTTEDTTLGNSLSVSDPVTLYEADGEHLIDAFMYPSNPGNAVSVERVIWYGALDDEDNWQDSTCPSGSSPGVINCVSAASSAAAESSYDIVITEVMANADSESTGEFVELYNNGSSDVDLLNWVFWDGDSLDTIQGFSDFYDTVLAAGQYALILDADYAGDYSTIPSSALLLVTDDSTLGSGLSTSDDIYIYEDNAVSLVDSFTSPWNPGNAISIERIDVNTEDISTNWEASTCSTGSSPGQGTCP